MLIISRHHKFVLISYINLEVILSNSSNAFAFLVIYLNVCPQILGNVQGACARISKAWEHNTTHCQLLPLLLFICSRMMPFRLHRSLFSTSPTCPCELELTSNFLYYLGSQESQLRMACMLFSFHITTHNIYIWIILYKFQNFSYK